MFLFADATDEIESNIEEINEKVSQLSEITDGLLNKIINFGFEILIAIVIFFVGKLVLKFVRRFVKNLFIKSKVDGGVAKFVDSIVKAVGYVLIVIIICGQIGIQTTSLITLLGTAGLSVGLALEGCFSNFAGGLLLLIAKPFVVGDYIVIDNVEGTVEKIDIIYTTLVTVDNKSIQIPNGTVSNSTVTNVTHQEKRRLDLDVGIHYDANLKKAKEIAAQVMEDSGYMLADEENMVVIKELGESSVILEIRMWTGTDDYWLAKFYMNEKIKEKFDENGITIPYNQLDVHIQQ